VRVDDQQSQPGADSLDPGSGWSRLVETRCDFAELARREAEAAETRVAETRRQLDAQLPTLISVQTVVDPRATRAARKRPKTPSTRRSGGLRREIRSSWPPPPGWRR